MVTYLGYRMVDGLYSIFFSTSLIAYILSMQCFKNQKMSYSNLNIITASYELAKWWNNIYIFVMYDIIYDIIYMFLCHFI